MFIKKMLLVTQLLLLIGSICLLTGCNANYTEPLSFVSTAIEHPFEWLFSDRHLCELQHGVQQQYGGMDSTTLCWSTSNHTITDRATNLFGKNPYSQIELPEGIRLIPYLGNRDAAYNMTLARNAGKHGENYNLLFYEYDGRKCFPIIFELDGISNIMYSWNYICYVPYKFLRRMSCTIHETKCPGLGWWSFFDGLWGLPVAIFELVIACFVGIIGLFTGTIMHPINTICNIIPGIIWFLGDFIAAIFAFIGAIIELILAVISGIWALIKAVIGIIIIFVVLGALVANKSK